MAYLQWQSFLHQLCLQHSHFIHTPSFSLDLDGPPVHHTASSSQAPSPALRLANWHTLLFQSRSKRVDAKYEVKKHEEHEEKVGTRRPRKRGGHMTPNSDLRKRSNAQVRLTRAATDKSQWRGRRPLCLKRRDIRLSVLYNQVPNATVGADEVFFVLVLFVWFFFVVVFCGRLL